MANALDRALDSSPGSDDFNTQPRVHQGPFRNRHNQFHSPDIIGNDSGDCRKKCIVIGFIIALLAVIMISVSVILALNTRISNDSVQIEASNLSEKERFELENDLISNDLLERLQNLGKHVKNTNFSDVMIKTSETSRQFDIFFDAIVDNDEALALLWSSNVTKENLKEAFIVDNRDANDETKIFQRKWPNSGDLAPRLLHALQNTPNRSRIVSPLTSAWTEKPRTNVDQLLHNDILTAINKTLSEVHENTDFVDKVKILYENYETFLLEKGATEILDDLKFLEDNSFLGNETENVNDGLRGWINKHKDDNRFKLFLSMLFQNNETLKYFHQANITAEQLKLAIANYQPEAREASTHREAQLGFAQIVDTFNEEFQRRAGMPADHSFGTPMVMDDNHFLRVINQTVNEVYMNEGFMQKVRLLYENLNEMGNRTLKYIEHGINDSESDTTEDDDSTSINQKLTVLNTDFNWLVSMQEKMKEMLDNRGNEDNLTMERNRNLAKLLDTESLDNLYQLTIQKQKDFGFRQITAELKDMGFQAMSETSNETNTENVIHPLIKKAMKLKKIEESMSNLVENEAQGRIGGNSLNQNSSSSKLCDLKIELPCADNKGCYLKEQKCDRYVECKDNSDELNCNCMDYLPQQRKCDGYKDCPYGEDEANCFCPKGMFYCGKYDKAGKTPICISDELRCDNIEDCDTGTGYDEMFCYELRSEGVDSTMSSPQRSGILHVLNRGIWQMVSVELTSLDFSNQDSMASNSDSLESGRYNEYLQTLAKDVCHDSMASKNTEANVQFELRPIELPTGNIAHLRLDMNQQDGVRPGGRYSYELLPPHNTSRVIHVHCSEPACGKTNGERLDFFQSKHVVNEKLVCENDPSTPECNAQELTSPKGFQDTDNRIVNGTMSSFGKWPFIVSLMRNGKFVCGASIIDQNWIVTAAHCVEGYQRDTLFFQVIAGMLRKDSRSSHQYIRTLDKIYIHPEYNSTWLSADIAIAKVDKSFNFNFASSPVCLPDDIVCDHSIGKGLSHLQEPVTGAHCVSAGWGNVKENGPASDELREFVLPVLSECVKSYNDVETQICGGYEEGGKDSCQGDSGGPLFCKYPDELDKWYLGGIISHGQGCARPNTPGVYTRVCSYKTWIQGTIEKVTRNKRSIINPHVSSLSGSKINSILNDEQLALSNRRADLDFSFFDPESDKLHQAITECPTFTCDGGVCMELAKVCNSYVDCFDGTDELGCVFDPSTNAKTIDPTFLEETKNKNKKAPIKRPKNTNVPAINKPHRPEHKGAIFSLVGVDLTCESGEFKCKKMFQCIPQDKVCDMKVDCNDHTDEENCKCHNYLSKTDPSKMCDGYPDCDDWEDEVGCSYCHEFKEKGIDAFYCDLSKKCIAQEKMCDTVHDCSLREDERYCINIANADTVVYKEDGRPLHHSQGLIAINTRGRWRPVIAPKWEDRMNNQICKYMGFRGAIDYKLIGQEAYPHLQKGDLQVQLNYPGDVRHKRQSESKSYFIESKCQQSPSCGVMHLYNFLGRESPKFGAGTYPWHVNLYKDGSYICGGTLVHPEWILLGQGCALKINPPNDFVIARMGGHRDLEFKSAHDQFKRVVEITEIAGAKIYLAMLESPVEMNEYVNIICIPDKRWIPRGTECVITGRHEGNLKHPHNTIVTGRCNERSSTDFDLCSTSSGDDECYENWSGALACPDSTGVYYAVGVYNTGGCTSSNPPPTVFKPLMTNVVRAAIRNIITSMAHPENPKKTLEDTNCSILDGKYRCPLGKCLEKHQQCDGITDCLDGSDEDIRHCFGRGPRSCQHINQTHCQCEFMNDMRCNNNICMDKSKFCDGTNDCGDWSDEPINCNTCSVSLKTKEPWRLCDGKIDCIDDKNDMGGDEASKLCCPKDDHNVALYGTQRVRCALWGLNSKTSKTYDTSEIMNTEPLQCVPTRSICDGDIGTPSCVNGADESDCMNIWPSLKHSNSISTSEVEKMPEDAFGRFASKSMGYLYFTMHGRSFLYCADPAYFIDEEKKKIIGKAICLAENHLDLDAMTLHQPTRTAQRPKLTEIMSTEEDEAYKKCVLIYLACKPFE